MEQCGYFEHIISACDKAVQDLLFFCYLDFSIQATALSYEGGAAGPPVA